jgi:signal transduction histidine kinase
MKHVYGAILIGLIVFDQILNYNNHIFGIVALLGALCLFIIKERYFDNIYTSLCYGVFILILTILDSSFILLAGIVLLDLFHLNKYTLATLTATGVIYIAVLTRHYSYIFHLISACLFGYIIGTKDRNEKKNIALLDAERNLRYALERTQNELITSRKEVEQLAEIRERNRIAHEIHDNIGHSMAGVIFQLEAAMRLLHKDIGKTEDILRLCGQKLAEALELTRNTVHNISVVRKTDIAKLEEIVNNFKFCLISFKHSGDISRVSAFNMKILESNVMEALTNASKYSKAESIEIRIDIGKKNIRLFYKDDGIGCDSIKENLGLEGMKGRVKNAGGIISIDGKNGFLIVCNLPIE